METFPELKTPRLCLGALSEADIPNIIAFAGNPKVAASTLNIPHPYKEADALFWINNAKQGFENKTIFTFGIRTHCPDEFIGGIGIKINQRFNRGEIGYWIAEPFWNKGYASEALGAVLKFGFEEINLHKIFATFLIENIASGKVMIKNGMIKEGELKDHTKKENNYRTLYQYRLTIDEYKDRKA
jgi:[ribosomal protein S5]-alanine N-acetyltransferase